MPRTRFLGILVGVVAPVFVLGCSTAPPRDAAVPEIAPHSAPVPHLADQAAPHQPAAGEVVEELWRRPCARPGRTVPYVQRAETGSVDETGLGTAPTGRVPPPSSADLPRVMPQGASKSEPRGPSAGPTTSSSLGTPPAER